MHVKLDRPMFDEPAQDGQPRIVIVRAGAADEQRGQLLVGDVIALPASEAEAYVRSGCADFASALEMAS